MNMEIIYAGMNMLDNFFINFKKEDNISNPPYEYSLLASLNEEEYPRYLKKIFKYTTGKTLNLQNPKTFNEKIQWLKLYDTTPLKTQLTDNVLVRDWVKNKIGEEYLKPVLWIGKSFDEIPFDELPQQFLIKCNHGCKWHYKIKDKHKFLEIPQLFNSVKECFDGWMSQSFAFWAGLELQYKNINPQILIEPILNDTDNPYSTEYEVYCFNGKAKIYQKMYWGYPAESSIYDENFNQLEFKFYYKHKKILQPADSIFENLKLLSEILAKDFKLVRIDWLKSNNKVYFNEMTFTPYSGFYVFEDKKTDLYLSKLLNIK